jgi:serine/threonine protein kinase/predicted ATPase
VGQTKAKKIRIQCPECRELVKLKEAPPGKKFDCPKCNQTIDFRCSKCDARAKLKDALTGKKFRCLKCDKKIRFRLNDPSDDAPSSEPVEDSSVSPIEATEESGSEAAPIPVTEASLETHSVSVGEGTSLTRPMVLPEKVVAPSHEGTKTATAPGLKTGDPETFESAAAPESVPEIEAAPSVEAQPSVELPPTFDGQLVNEDCRETDPAGNSFERTIITPWKMSDVAGGEPDVDNDFASSPTVDRPAGSGPPSSSVPTSRSDVDSSTPDVRPERQSFGRYEVQKILGKGAFGAVYLSFDTQLERQVAIKAPRLEVDSKTVEREFLAEARQLAKLNHPGIVSVYDVGIDGGQCYIVSDYLEGQSLSDWLKENKPDWRQATQIASSLAAGLSHAHSHRVVHRDLKPANVIMTEGLSPVIVDFGLALSDTQTTGVEKGILAGTPAYMAPEQTLGEGHRIDGRTDIYALGVILYYMLTRQLPFQSKNLDELFRQIQEDDPQPIRQLSRDIPRELEAICMKAMAKNFTKRHTTADDLVSDLTKLSNTAVSGQQSSILAPPRSATSETIDLPSGDRASIEESLSSQNGGIGLSSVTSSVRSSVRSSTRRRRDAERRRITVVQCGCDVFGSDAVLETLDEEEQGELLEEFQRLCQAAVIRHQGGVVQPTDEGLLACFGFPIAREDSTQQAVRAGLEIVRGMKPINDRLKRQHNVELTVTVTVHSDHAVVEEREDSLTLTGQIRKVVGQLESFTESNSVLISEATYQLVKGYFECDILGKRKIKGAGTVPVYTVRRAHANDRLEAAEIKGELTPLIGRNREVGLIQERWEQASEGMGQVVLLIGEAGLGKSRLVHVLKEHVKEQSVANCNPIIEWRTSQNHQHSGLYPAIECLERMLEFEPQMTPAERLDSLVGHLAELALDGDEEIALLASMMSIPLAGRYPSLDLQPQQKKDRTFHTLLDWVREMSTRQPVLFVVEDLHWVDPSTLEFLELMVQEGQHDSIMTLLTFRPEFQTPWSSLAHQTSVALNRLTKRQVGEMIAIRSGISDIPQNLVDHFVERTDGVPLFVEEFAAMIVDKAGEDGLENFSIDEIPATLQDLLLARLDRMASNIEFVQIAAAIGREFRFDVIAAVTGLTDDDLIAELALLVSSELLNQRGRPPRTRYTFKHALVQDAAYDSLVRKKRQEVHQRIAETLDRQFPDISEPHPELVAYHFTEANVPEKAIEYWQRASTRSLERYAHAEAIGHLTSGLDVLGKMPESPERDRREIQMRTSLGVPLQATLGYSAPEVEFNYVRAHELCGETPEAFPVLYGLFRYFMLQAKYPRSIELGEQLVRLADASGDPAGVVAANRAIASPLVYKGDHARAVPHLEKVISIEATPDLRAEFYSFDVVDPWITSLSYLSWVKWLLGYPDQAAEHSREAVSTAEKLEHPFSLALGLSFSQWLHQFNQDVESTRKAADGALAIAREKGFAFWIGWGQVLRGWARARQGEGESGIDEMREGIVAWRKQGSELGCHYYYVMLAEACAANGQMDEAMTALDDGQKFAELTGEGFYAPEITRLRGEFILQQSSTNIVDAEALFRQAIDLAASQQAKSLELRAAMSLARLLANASKTAEARSILSTTFNWFTEGFGTHDLIEAKSMLEAFD